MPTLRAFALSFLLLTAGCGSIEKTFVRSRRGEVHPYMGVAHTVDFATEGMFQDTVTSYVIAAVDLPFSFLADTLLLPYTLPVWLRDRHWRR